MHEIADFLRRFPPFDAADDAAIQAAVQATEIEYFPAGAFVVRAGEETAGFVHVVRAGNVELMDDGRVIDVCGPGEVVGLPSLVSDLPAGLDVRAAEDLLTYRIPSESLLPLLSGRSGLRFVARTVRRRAATGTGVQHAETMVEEVRSLARPAVVAGPDESVRDVVRRMQEADASCAVIRSYDGGIGIITDHDLRNRVLATGTSRSTPVGEVATMPARRIGPTTTSEDAVLTMLEHGIRHLPVVDDDGTVVGVVEDIDLLAAQSRTPVRVRRALARASTIPALIEIAQGIRPAIVGAVRAGQSADVVSATLSSLDEAVVAKAVELHLRERELPPVPFVWLVTGSVARHEAVLSSDLDSLLAWEAGDDDDAAQQWVRRFAEDVLVTLGACGLAHDENGVRADDPRFCRSTAGWQRAVRGWAADPTAHQGDIYLATLADARPVWGHAVWQPVAEEIARANEHAYQRSSLHRIATGLRPPTGFIRDLVIEESGEHEGTLDLKRGGLAPIVAIGRYVCALAAGSALTTYDRIRAAEVRGVIDEDDARDLVDALEVVQSVRLEHQATAVLAGTAPDDRIRPDQLTTLQRRRLRDAFRLVARVQRALPSPGDVP